MSTKQRIDICRVGCPHCDLSQARGFGIRRRNPKSRCRVLSSLFLIAHPPRRPRRGPRHPCIWDCTFSPNIKRFSPEFEAIETSKFIARRDQSQGG